jgi:hypothetical protein
MADYVRVAAADRHANPRPGATDITSTSSM